MAVRIQLTQDQHALVDASSLSLLSKYSWYAVRDRKGFYARAWIRGRPVGMHRVLLGAVTGQLVDHVNGDKLDNRLRNLRFCTARENAGNKRIKSSTGYKGVHFDKRAKKHPYTARGMNAGKRIRLGVYSNAEDAARAYDAWAIDYYGDFACLNFPRMAA